MVRGGGAERGRGGCLREERLRAPRAHCLRQLRVGGTRARSGFAPASPPVGSPAPAPCPFPLPLPDQPTHLPSPNLATPRSCNSLCLKLFGAAAVGMLVTVVLLAACFAPPGTNRCRVKSSADGTVPGALPGAAEAELAAPPLPPAAPDAAAAAVPPASPDATPPPSPDAPPGAVPPPSPGAATPPADSFVDSAAAAPAADAAAAAAPATDAATTPAAADAAAATPADVAGPPAAGPMTPDVRRRFGPMPWVPSIDEYCAKPENEPQPPCFFAWCNDGNNTLTPADEAACATYEQWCTEVRARRAAPCIAAYRAARFWRAARCPSGGAWLAVRPARVGAGLQRRRASPAGREPRVAPSPRLTHTTCCSSYPLPPPFPPPPHTHTTAGRQRRRPRVHRAV